MATFLVGSGDCDDYLSGETCIGSAYDKYRRKKNYTKINTKDTGTCSCLFHSLTAERRPCTVKMLIII